MIERPAAPQRPPRRDWFAPAILAGSLVLHVGIVAPMIWTPRAQAARPPVETPVEVVQLPPEPDKPKPAGAKAKPPEPPRQHAQASPPAPKPPAPKPADTKRAAKPEATPDGSVARRMAQLLGPMPAMAMPALGSGDDPLDDSVSYQQLVLSRVAKQKREDRHDGVQTHAVITFAVGDGGEVVTCEVREKSLDPTLDAEAVAKVYRGAPYPPPPPGAPRRFSFGLAFHTL